MIFLARLFVHQMSESEPVSLMSKRRQQLKKEKEKKKKRNCVLTNDDNSEPRVRKSAWKIVKRERDFKWRKSIVCKAVESFLPICCCCCCCRGIRSGSSSNNVHNYGNYAVSGRLTLASLVRGHNNNRSACMQWTMQNWYTNYVCAALRQRCCCYCYRNEED